MNISAYVKVLELQKPFNIVLKSKGNKKADAHYWNMVREGELVSHLIHIYLLNISRSLDTLIIHELIHAWQVENNINETAHGPEFIRMAKKMEYIFGVKNIYIPELDK